MQQSLAYAHARANAPEPRKAISDPRRATIKAVMPDAPFAPVAPIVELRPKEKNANNLKSAPQGVLAELDKKIGSLEGRLGALSKIKNRGFTDYVDDAYIVLDDAKELSSSMKPCLVIDNPVHEKDPALGRKLALTSLMLDLTLHRLSD